MMIHLYEKHAGKTTYLKTLDEASRSFIYELFEAAEMYNVIQVHEYESGKYNVFVEEKI